MSFVVGVGLLALATALACALPGVFLVLRRSAMLVDAVAHAVLPGIVLGYAISRDLGSPLLIVGAAAMGMTVVIGSQLLARSGLLAGDAPQGLIFPVLFSIGVLMISLDFADVHLDTHVVLVGDLNLAAIRTLELGGLSLGPGYLYVMLAVLAANAALVVGGYHRLTVATFDPGFARSIGIRVAAIDLLLMISVCLTITAAFNAVGAILVLALMIAPAATAYLLTDRLPAMIVATLVVAAAGALLGFGAAYALDAPTSAAMSLCYGVLFVAAVAAVRLRRRWIRRRGQRTETQMASVAERPSETGAPPSTLTSIEPE